MKYKKHHYSVTLAHYLSAAILFLALAVMTAFSRDAFAGHYFQPRILAITHMAVLGWGTCMIFGACYQLIPVILETELYSTGLAWASWGTLLPGVISLVYAFWVFEPGICMQTGALLLLVSIILFTLNIYLTAAKTKKQTIQEDFIFTACLFLCFTALIGATLVFNFTMAFLPQGQLHYLRIHAHLGLAGWFLLMIIGVSSKLVPMFLVSSYKNDRLLQVSYYLIVAALIAFSTDSYFFGLNIKTWFIAAVGVAGIGCYLVYMGKCLRGRIKKHIDLPMKHGIFSFILLIAGTVCIPFIIYYYLRHGQLDIRFTFIYGIILIMGWITALILGQTFKTLPFIVWAKHYEHLAGKAKIPMPADLFKPGLLRVQMITFIVFCLSFVPGCAFGLALLTGIGCLALLITAIIYVTNVLIVVFHKTKTYDEL
ncbi:MAG: hypothetical protein JSU01_22345 [Bacteroidetes bacterium]|nr:hypothetical protein [Bacteroidota bacterium]